MYSETSKNAAMRRANDEFLRRMLGGELGAAERTDDPQILSCRVRGEGVPSPLGRRRQPSAPSCNAGDGAGMTCPRKVAAPALAMVYSPVQCWEGLLEPMQALRAGSQFSSLVLPLEEKKFGESEVNHRRCSL